MAAQYTEEISHCEEQLRKLLAKERERDTIASLQARSYKKTEIDQLLADALPGSETPGDLLGRITSNLGIDLKITAKVEVAVKQYNIAMCRDVSSQLRDRLPRELRDMVYQYLCPGDVYLCAKESCPSNLLHVHDFHGDDDGMDVDSDFDSDSDNSDTLDLSQTADSDSSGLNVIDHNHKSYISPFPRTDTDLICSQHYWQDKVLGAELARELIETFYRTSTFHIKFTGPMRTSPHTILSDVLDKDRFGLRLSPANSISHVKLDLGIQDAINWDTSSRNYRDIIGWIKTLHTLKKNTRIDIRICQYVQLWSDFEVEAPILDQGMELVFPHLLGLRQAGHRVGLEFGPSCLDDVKEVSAKWLDRFEHEADEDGDQLTAE